MVVYDGLGELNVAYSNLIHVGALVELNCAKQS